MRKTIKGRAIPIIIMILSEPALPWKFADVLKTAQDYPNYRSNCNRECPGAHAEHQSLVDATLCGDQRSSYEKQECTTHFKFKTQEPSIDTLPTGASRVELLDDGERVVKNPSSTREFLNRVNGCDDTLPFFISLALSSSF